MAQRNDHPSDPDSAPDPTAGRIEERQDGIILAHAGVTRWDAPLPPPAAYQMYENTLPGAAERLLVIAESQHRNNIAQTQAASDRSDRALEISRTIIVSDARRSYLGIILAFVLAMTGLLGGIFLIAIGHGGFGLTLCLAPLAGLAAVFVYGTRSRRAERQRSAHAADAGRDAAGSDPAGAQ